MDYTHNNSEHQRLTAFDENIYPALYPNTTFDDNHSLRDTVYIPHHYFSLPILNRISNFAEDSRELQLQHPRCTKQDQLDFEIFLETHSVELVTDNESETICNTQEVDPELEPLCALQQQHLQHQVHLQQEDVEEHSETTRSSLSFLSTKSEDVMAVVSHLELSSCSSRKRSKVQGEQEESYACDQCGAVFQKKFNRNKHIRLVHDRVRQFPCHICNFAFMQKHHLKTHIENVHEKLRPSACHECNKSFGSNGALNKHIRLCHLKVRPYACEHCGLSFQQKCRYNKHLLKHN